ncbi:MAG: DUF1501 domain-containing protein [Verrucomicrobiales bacterium]
MLSLHDPAFGTASRRAFLRVGSLGLAGLALPDLLFAKEKKLLKDRSVVFLFMHGGPPQHELFDPKLDAPSGVRSATGEIPTSLPGVTFGGTMHGLAKRAHRLAVVRSFATGDGNHDIKPVVGRFSADANLGSLYARVAGSNRPGTGMPTNLALFPRAVDEAAQPENNNFGRFASTGAAGGAYAPFVPGAGGPSQGDLRLNIARARLDDRRGLLADVDALRRRLDATGELEGLAGYQEQAFDTILGGIADAFDLSREDAKTVARYDTAPLVHPDKISKKWNNHKNYRDHGQTLGKLMLMARRLCERGAGFVTVTTNFVWDFHADRNNATLTEGMEYVARPFDHAVSAFLDDVEARGLSDKILLVCCGEMGRTPKINDRGGRDHWGRLAPLILAGGGLKVGQVIGQSDAQGGEPAGDPVTIPHLNATIMHSLVDRGEVRLMESIPQAARDAIVAGSTIPGLV